MARALLVTLCGTSAARAMSPLVWLFAYATPPEASAGPCLSVDQVLHKVQPLHNELIAIAAGTGDEHEGNCVTNHRSTERLPELVAKQRNLVRLAQEFGGQNILEIGFNSGLSAALFLTAHPSTRVTSIDIGSHPYVALCGELLRQRFPGRFRLIVGDSAKALPGLPSHIFAGLIHVDGSHDVDDARADLLHAHARLLGGGAMLMDDTDTPSLSLLLDALVQSHPGDYDELRYEEHDGLMSATTRFRHRAIIKKGQRASMRACQQSESAAPAYITSASPSKVALPPSAPPTLLHVGGHHAEEAKGYAEQGFSDRVVFIEAMPEAHSVCERVAARHGQACVNALLWDVDGVEQTFHVTSDDAGKQWSSSIFELTAANDRWREDQRPRPFAQMQLKSHRFDTLAAQYPSVLGRAFTHLVRWRSNPQGRSRSDGVAKPWISHDRC